jgi:hypothetical protein
MAKRSKPPPGLPEKLSWKDHDYCNAHLNAIRNYYQNNNLPGIADDQLYRTYLRNIMQYYPYQAIREEPNQIDPNCLVYNPDLDPPFYYKIING